MAEKNIKWAVLHFAAFLCLAFFGCTSDKEESPVGQYVFQNDTLTVAIAFETDGVTYIHIFTNNSIEFQDISSISSYTGAYPNYTVTIAGENKPTLVFSCAFTSANSFTATVVESHLDDVFWLYRERHIYLPQTMLFNRNNKTLDINGDGILDWSQNF